MEEMDRPLLTFRNAGELCLLLAVPVILASIYYLTPAAFQRRLVLDQTNPELHAFWTNALVHEHRPGDGHLHGNIVGYLLLVLPCWLLYFYRWQKRRFWAGFLVILTLGPLATSFSSYVAFHEILGLHVTNERGFSGVVGSFVGFLIMSIVQTFAREQEEPVAMLSVGIYFGYLLTGLGIVTNRLPILAVGILGILLTFGATRTGFVAKPQQLAEWSVENLSLSAALVIAVLTSTIAFGFSLPADITNGGDSLTNIVAHGVGILFGMGVEIVLRYSKFRPVYPGDHTSDS